MSRSPRGSATVSGAPQEGAGAAELIAAADLEAAARAIAGVALRTPPIACRGALASSPGAT